MQLWVAPHQLNKQSKTHIQNSKDLVDKLVEVEIEGEVRRSFDVTAPFTSVPGKEVVKMAVKRANKRPNMVPS